MGISIYTLISLILIAWFLIANRKNFTFLQCVLICIGIYCLTPIIIIAAIIYILVYLLSK